MSTDWKAVARAQGMAISDNDLERELAPLDGLESTFAKAAAALTPGDDVAVRFSAEAE